MKTRTLIIWAGVALFAGAVVFALLREVNREEATLAHSISGIVEIAPALLASGQADVVKTDRLVLVLVDPATRAVVAMRTESPVTPPQTISIGQQNSLNGQTLQGAYLLIGFTDKDGDPYRPVPGEVYGELPQPVGLGTEQVRLVLDQPYRGQAPLAAPAPGGGYDRRSEVYRLHPLMAAADNPCAEGEQTMIQVEARLKPGLAWSIEPADRLVVKLFLPDDPALTKVMVVPLFALPYRLWVGPTVDMSGRPKRDAFYVELSTDRDRDIASLGPGELVARSTGPVPLGTRGLVLELDLPR